MEVVGSRESYFDAILVLKILSQWSGNACLVEAEQERVALGRKLQQGDAVALTAVKAGACLGVKSHNRGSAQGRDCAFDLGYGGDDVYVPGEGDPWHFVNG